MTPSKDSFEHTNRLIHETSPYLLQHAHNPVDWYAWGSEALDRSKREDRLILLSIGYAACHWCHVMERESFENERIAALMNQLYVNIKVDREERPDLDEIYMAATVALNHGQGGWPMTVFLSPELEPVFAGTYFHPEGRFGRPGFSEILIGVDKAWQDDREGLRTQAGRFTERLKSQMADLGPSVAVGTTELRLALEQYADDFDPMFGGFGPAPKFPPATSLSLLLRLHTRFGDERALHMVCKTLDSMASGGIYDHVGGGFARYSTDREWLIPHFEKMLYDNALLAGIYLEAYQVTQNILYKDVAVETLDYVLREMTSPEGGFYSSTDADSEGEEGKFFVWTPEEIADVLDERSALCFCTCYDITADGNWEGKSIPNVRRPFESVATELNMTPLELRDIVTEARKKLYERRLKRVAPGLDDKIITSWNGMMINSLAAGYRVLGDERYLTAATRAAEFLLTTLRDNDEGLLRTYRAGKAHLNAYLEDYACFGESLIELYEASGEPRYLREAMRLLEVLLTEFRDDASGAFFHTSRRHERMIMRYREGTDGATPSANATAANVLARMSCHLDRDDLREKSLAVVGAYGRSVVQFPRAFAKALIVVDLLLDGPIEVVLAGRRGAADLQRLRAEVANRFIPHRVEALRHVREEGEFDDLPLLQGKSTVDGKAALYICLNGLCSAPITDPTQVANAIAEACRKHQRQSE